MYFTYSLSQALGLVIDCSKEVQTTTLAQARNPSGESWDNVFDYEIGVTRVDIFEVQVKSVYSFVYPICSMMDLVTA